MAAAVAVAAARDRQAENASRSKQTLQSRRRYEANFITGVALPVDGGALVDIN
jgi:hypothetical protein